MLESPTKFAQGPINVEVKSNGKTVSAINLISITVARSINRIPLARILIKDGSAADNDYPLSKAETFEPGAEIEISIGYDSGAGVQLEKIFSGVVVRHRLQIDNDQGSRLAIECRDKAFAMTLDRKNLANIDKKDSDVITSLIGNYTGLKANVSATRIEYGEQVQYYCTDWDYMLMRAEVNGMVVIVEDGEVTVAPPAVTGNAVLQVTSGEDIIKFDADIDGRTQLQSVEANAWDIDSQKMENRTASPKKLNEQGNLSSDLLARAVGPETFRIQTPSPINKDALDDWANARQLKAGLARIQGKVSFQGNAKVKVGSLIKLVGVGERFDGNIYVSRIEHEMSAGEWVTHVDFGLKPEWFVEDFDVVAPPASGWVPGIAGLHIGIVKKLDEDPEKQHRIQVMVPVLGEQAEAVWARMSTYYASQGFGSFFVPEINDEVVLGFMNNNPSQPVILGSMYSSNRAPAKPYQLEAENNLKSVVTRSQLKIEFDDNNKIIRLETPTGNTVILNDDEKSITIKDQNNNSMVMNSDGIALDSCGDITISAKGDVKIDATSNVDVSAKSDVNVDGANINQSAKVEFTAKGSASAELSSSGQTTVKGAMVMIN